jgi:two-component system, OmpR family, copper resistance phosphate regulon response regulator CusR
LKSRLQVHDLLLDPASHEVSRAGVMLNLTATEYRVLEFLMRRAGHAVSRAAIIEGVWGFEEDIETNTVDAFIRHLREKIDLGHARKLIQTVRGYGYILREDP